MDNSMRCPECGSTELRKGASTRFINPETGEIVPIREEWECKEPDCRGVLVEYIGRRDKFPPSIGKVTTEFIDHS